MDTFLSFLILRGKHPQLVKEALVNRLVVQSCWGSSSSLHAFTLWSSPRYDSVTLISLTEFKLNFPPPTNLTGSYKKYKKNINNRNSENST